MVFGATFFWVALIMGFLFTLLFVFRRLGWLRLGLPVQRAFACEQWVLLGYVMLNGLLYAARPFVDAVYLLYGFAGLTAVGMLYAFLTAPYEQPFLAQVKNFIGTVLGSMILPVMLKAYLLQHGL